jgi:hypothetical protein
MKKSQLKQIIKEEIGKILITECFIDETFLDLFEENPKIYDILKDNIMDMDGDITKYQSKEELADDLSHWGGASGFDGIANWNKKDLIRFFEKLEEIKSISPSTLDALKKEMEKEYNVFTKKYMHDMIQRVSDKLKKLYGNEHGDYYDTTWVSNAICKLPKNLL